MIIKGRDYQRGEHVIDGQRVVVADSNTAVWKGPVAEPEKAEEQPAKKPRKKRAKKAG